MVQALPRAAGIPAWPFGGPEQGVVGLIEPSLREHILVRKVAPDFDQGDSGSHCNVVQVHGVQAPLLAQVESGCQDPGPVWFHGASSGPYFQIKYSYRHLHWPRFSVASHIVSVDEPPCRQRHEHRQWQRPG
jgi:hypothetical protein